MRLLFILFIFLLSTNLYSQEKITKKDFKWLTGSWQMKQGKLTIAENWKEGKDSTFIGEGFVIKGNDTIVREQMRIDKMGNFWVFIAQVNNNNPVLFTLKAGSNAQELEFENMEHNNPQRVVYEFVSEKKLHARTEADIKGKEEVDEYEYTRVND